MTTIRSSITAADEQLIDALYVPLRRFAAVVSNWGEDPDDLLHDAWLRVLERRPLADLDNPAAFVRRTMMNLAANRRRQAGSRRWLRGRWNIQNPGPTVDGYPSDLADLAGLPGDQRATLYLAEVEGYSYDEIGKMMGCTANAARMRAMRARRRLRSALEAEV
jgi:DNA-directed RNA polymerase specialized sigma24 family protein